MKTLKNLDTIPAAFVGDAVKAIHCFSTGRGSQHKEHRYGSTKPQLWWVLTSRSWISLPISVFLIEHKDGLVLFDTGLDPAIAHNPTYISQAIGRFLMKRIFRFDVGPQDKLGEKLKANGFDSSKISKAVISHLHFDHIGGIADIPQADLIVSRAEWEQLSQPHPEREWILREHINIPGTHWSHIDFPPTDDPALKAFGKAHDLMGDGSLMLLPTPGHTPGSMSLLIRSAAFPPMLLIGDLAYSVEALFENRMPGTGDAEQLKDSYTKVQQLTEDFPGLIIIPSHDDAAITKLQSALKHPAPQSS